MKIKSERVLILFLIVFFLSSCATTGYIPSREDGTPNSEHHSSIGSVSVNKTYWHPFFMGKSPAEMRKDIDQMLLKEAKKCFPSKADGVYNTKYESYWNGASLIFYFSMLGFVEKVSGVAFVYNEENDRLLKEERFRIKKEEYEKRIEEEAILYRGFSEKEISAIKNKQIFLGMSREALIKSWPFYSKINESTGSWGKHEQFIYSNIYVYVENGFVVSWQK